MPLPFRKSADRSVPAVVPAGTDSARGPSDRIAEMIELAQKVDSESVRQYVLGPSKYAERPPYSETGGEYKLRLKMDALAKLSIDVFGDASRYASLPEYAPSSSPAVVTSPAP